MLNIRLAFVMLGSSDLERATKFYTELLGLQLKGRFAEFVFFDTGDTTFALNGELAAAEGGSHECVFSVESVTQAHAALKDRVAFLNEPRAVNNENWAVNFRDPDGHLCSLYGAR
jgi:catechol 2,3-dioxygenase-like lactoylglutathione lyase family enzyme